MEEIYCNSQWGKESMYILNGNSRPTPAGNSRRCVDRMLIGTKQVWSVIRQCGLVRRSHLSESC